MKPDLLVNLSHIIVLVGVIFTALGSYGSFHFGKQVQSLKDKQSVEKENSLNTKIDGLVESNENLHDKLNPFEKMAQDIFPTIERSKALDKLLDSFDTLQKKTDDLEKNAAPRVVPADKKAHLIDVLKKHSGENITVTSIMGDQEAFSFAEDIKSIFASSGWNVNGVNQSIYTKPVVGLILLTDNDQPEVYELCVLSTFNNCDIKVLGEVVKRGKEDLEIVIGTKDV